MAATNFTPIQLYHSSTASAAPTAGNLANGELAINITDGKLYYKDNAGVVQVIATKGAGTIGGSTTQIQYNNAGALAGSAAMTFNSGTSTVTLTTLNLTNALGATFGGTAQSTYTQGDILYSSATNTLAKLGIGTANFILTSTGSVPQWVAPSSISVNTATNLAGGLAGSVPYQSALDTTTFLAIGAANRVMTSTGTAPQWVTSLTGLTGVTSSSLTNTSLTSGRVVLSTAGGQQTDDADLTFDGTTLSAGGLSVAGFSSMVRTTTIGNSNFNGAAIFAPSTPAKLYLGTGVVTDITSAAASTNTTGAIASLAITPIAATNASVTYTNAATLYIAGAPSAGTNVTLTNPYALYVAAGDAYFGGTVTAGTVNLTTLDLTNLEVTNIKAKDGTASITLADSTGVASFTANPVLSGGTTNGILYLNGSKVATSGSALTFDGTTLATARTTDGLIFQARGTSTAQLLLGVSSGNLYYDSSNGNATHYWQRNGATAMYLATTYAGYAGLSVGTGLAGIAGKLTVNEDLDSTYWGNSASIVLSNRNYGTNGNILGGLFVSTFRDVVNPHVPSGIWFSRNTQSGVSVSSDIVFGMSYPYNELGDMPSYRGRMQAQTGNFYWGTGAGTNNAGISATSSFYANAIGLGGQSNESLYMRRNTTGQYAFQTYYATVNQGQLCLQPYGGSVLVGATSDGAPNARQTITDSGSGIVNALVLQNSANNVSGQGVQLILRNSVYNGGGVEDDKYAYVRYVSVANYSESGRLEFGTNNGYGVLPVTRLTLDQYGNLATCGADSSLSVSGGGIVLLSKDYTISPNVMVGHASGVTSGNYYAQFQYAGSVIGSIVQSGTTGVGYNTNSDYRLKEDPQPIPDVIARFKRLNPLQYRWKASGELDEGFFAHELAEVCKNAVSGEKDAVDESGNIKAQAVDYGRITPFLSAVMANMLDRIEQLEARLAQEGK